MKKLLVSLFFCLSFTTVFATDGYFSHGYGTRYKAFAGAGMALYLDPFAAVYNPASLVYFGQGYELGLGFFMPFREYNVMGNPSGFGFGLAPGTVQSGKEFYVIPSVAANWMLSDNNSIGVAIYGNGGMNTYYETTPVGTFGGSSPTGVNLSQLFLNVSYSQKIGNLGSVGLGLIAGYQWFEATGLEAFAGIPGFTMDPASVTNNGSDNAFGFGFKAGYFKEMDRFNISASIQSKIYMGEFDSYAGLFAEQGDFDVPVNWSLGVAYKLSEDFIVLADFKQIMYSDVRAVGNPMAANNQLGNEEGPGFGWSDINVYKIGFQYAASEDLTLRAGFSFGDQPIQDSEVMFNILAPAVIQNHASFGLSKKIGENEISFAGTYAFSNTVSGPNPLEVPGQQTIDLTMNQVDLQLGFSF